MDGEGNGFSLIGWPMKLEEHWALPSRLKVDLLTTRLPDSFFPLTLDQAKSLYIRGLDRRRENLGLRFWRLARNCSELTGYGRFKWFNGIGSLLARLRLTRDIVARRRVVYRGRLRARMEKGIFKIVQRNRMGYKVKE